MERARWEDVFKLWGTSQASLARFDLHKGTNFSLQSPEARRSRSTKREYPIFFHLASRSSKMDQLKAWAALARQRILKYHRSLAWGQKQALHSDFGILLRATRPPRLVWEGIEGANSLKLRTAKIGTEVARKTERNPRRGVDEASPDRPADIDAYFMLDRSHTGAEWG